MADGKVVIDVDLDSKDAEKSVDKLNSKLDGAFQDKNGRWRAANGRFLTMKEKADLLGKSVGNLEGQGSRASLGIGKIVTALGLVAVGAKAIGMVTSALDGAISRYDTLNNFPSVLQLMGFSAEESSKAINRLSEGIDGLPTTLDSVASTAQRIAIMTGDLDGATETTLALNNAFLASGSSAADAQRGLEQYVQMLSKGEVDLQSWRSLQETMPVALNETAKAFGFTGASAQNDLYEALKEGNITFDQFNGKLVELSDKTGGFADMARESSTGIATSWQNMKTSVVKGVTDVIASIDEALGGVGSIAGIIDNAKVGIKAFFDFIVTNIPVAVAWLTLVKDSLEPWIPLLAGIVAGFLGFSVITSIVSTVGTAIAIFSGLRAALTGATLATHAASAAQAAYNLVLSLNPFVLVAAAIIGLIAALVLVYQNVEWFRTMVDAAWTWIKDITMVTFEAIKGVVLAVIGDIVTFGQELLEKFKTFWDENGQAIMTLVTMYFQNIMAVIKGIMGIIQGIFQVVWPIISGVVIVTWNMIKTSVENAINLVLGIIQTVMKLIQGDWEGAWNTIKGTAETIWENIVGFFEDIDLWQIGKDIIQGLIDGMGSMVTAAWEAAEGIVENIKGAFTKLFNVHSPSRWMRDMIGKNLVLGIGVGVEKNQKSALNSIKGLADDLKGQAQVELGVTNRLRGAKAPLGGILSNGLQLTQSIIQSKSNSNPYDDGEVKALLRQIAEKDSNVYMDKEKVGGIIDHEQARRTGLFGRRVAFD